MAIQTYTMPNYPSQSATIISTRDVAEVTPILEAQVNRLSESANDVDQQAMRLHALADRLLGPLAAAEGKPGAPVPSPSHSVGKLNDAHEWMERARANLSHAVQRLEAL